MRRRTSARLRSPEALGGSPGAASRPGSRAPAGAGWISTVVERVILFQVGCQILLLIPFLGQLRVLMRGAAYGVSIALLLFLSGSGRRHPAGRAAFAALAIVGISFWHPGLNTPLAGAAQFAMYLAILAPLYWVPRRRLDFAGIRRLFLILWAFHTASAAFGVLQVYFPGRFQPAMTTLVENVEIFRITLADGTRTLRPMGLTDFPGGAANSGFYATLLGLFFLVSDRARSLRAASACSMGIGLFCLYLAQIRSLLVLTLLCMACLTAFLAWRGRLSRSVGAAFLAPTLVLGVYVWAVSVGGATVSDRVGSLTQEDPGQVYYRNRGKFLEHTFAEMLPRYPLGGGLGRWGMMNSYFGDNSDPERGMIWVEIQLTGWVVDGGLPLVIAYGLALLAALWVAWRIANADESDDLWLWGAVILTYDLGALALSFNNPVFHSQMGLEFWLLNAALFAVYLDCRRRAASGSPRVRGAR